MGTVAVFEQRNDPASPGLGNRFRTGIVTGTLFKAFKEIVTSTPTDPHQLSTHGDRISRHLLRDKIEPQSDALAKNAVAFFKISRFHLKAPVFLVQTPEFGSQLSSGSPVRR